MHLLLGGLAILLASAQAYRPGDEICTYATSSTKCDVSSITPSKTDGSVLIYPGGKTRCAFDDFRNDKTGFIANATYLFQVFPKPEKKKLALIMGGGGACIGTEDCDFAVQCSLPTRLMAVNASARSSGIFNMSNPTNPLRDWNIVHVPVCTGDVHIGNKIVDAGDSPIAVRLGQSECLGQQKKTYLNGFENSRTAIEWAKANYPEVEELVLGGTSAGALGTQALAAYVADLWQVNTKRVKFGVLPDSFFGVLPRSFPAGKVLNYWGTCDLPGVFSPSLTAKCKTETLTTTEAGLAMMKAIPTSDWLFLSPLGDATQRLYYALCKDGVSKYPFNDSISIDEFFAEANTMLKVYKAHHPRVMAFFSNSTEHVFLNSEQKIQSVSLTGDVLTNFLAKWLANLGTGIGSEPTPTSTMIPATPCAK